MRFLAVFLFLLISASATPASEPIPRVSPVRPVSTYSIVARDSETGDLGVAVQSHWFSVGALVPWAQAGVGAVTSQHRLGVREHRIDVDPVALFGRRERVGKHDLGAGLRILESGPLGDGNRSLVERRNG